MIRFPLINPAIGEHMPQWQRVEPVRPGKLESFIAWAPIAVAVFCLSYFLAQQFLRPVVEGWLG